MLSFKILCNSLQLFRIPCNPMLSLRNPFSTIHSCKLVRIPFKSLVNPCNLDVIPWNSSKSLVIPYAIILENPRNFFKISYKPMQSRCNPMRPFAIPFYPLKSHAILLQSHAILSNQIIYYPWKFHSTLCNPLESLVNPCNPSKSLLIPCTSYNPIHSFKTPKFL